MRSVVCWILKLTLRTSSEADRPLLMCTIGTTISGNSSGQYGGGVYVSADSKKKNSL
mgnify:CR=1 FL=1